MGKNIRIVLLVGCLLLFRVGCLADAAAVTNSFPKYQRPVMTWVPPYAVEECQRRLVESFEGAGMKDSLTHLGLQFWAPTGTGGLERVGRTNDTGDAAIARLRDWGHTNGVRVLLCVFNGFQSADWEKARAGFARHPDAFCAALLAEVRRLNLDGVDVDLEGKGNQDEDREAFVKFIEQLSARLHAAGLHLTVDTFAYHWNAPNQTWWPDLLPHVDGLTTMGYEAIGTEASGWRSYAAQCTAAGAHVDRLMIGMPSARDEWSGRSVVEHLRGVKSAGKAGVAFWDAQLKGKAWHSPDVWKLMQEIRGGE